MNRLRFYSTCKISYLATFAYMVAEKHKTSGPERQSLLLTKMTVDRTLSLCWLTSPSSHTATWLELGVESYTVRMYYKRRKPEIRKPLVLCRGCWQPEYLLFPKRETLSLLPWNVSESSLEMGVRHLYLYSTGV